MISIDMNTYLLLDTLRLFVEAFGYAVGLTVCFVAGLYLGTIAREYVDQSDDK